MSWQRIEAEWLYAPVIPTLDGPRALAIDTYIAYQPKPDIELLEFLPPFQKASAKLRDALIAHYRGYLMALYTAELGQYAQQPHIFISEMRRYSNHLSNRHQGSRGDANYSAVDALMEPLQNVWIEFFRRSQHLVNGMFVPYKFNVDVAMPCRFKFENGTSQAMLQKLRSAFITRDGQHICESGPRAMSMHYLNGLFPEQPVGPAPPGTVGPWQTRIYTLEVRISDRQWVPVAFAAFKVDPATPRTLKLELFCARKLKFRDVDNAVPHPGLGKVLMQYALRHLRVLSGVYDEIVLEAVGAYDKQANPDKGIKVAADGIDVGLIMYYYREFGFLMYTTDKYNTDIGDMNDIIATTFNDPDEYREKWPLLRAFIANPKSTRFKRYTKYGSLWPMRIQIGRNAPLGKVGRQRGVAAVRQEHKIAALMGPNAPVYAGEVNLHLRHTDLGGTCVELFADNVPAADLIDPYSIPNLEVTRAQRAMRPKAIEERRDIARCEELALVNRVLTNKEQREMVAEIAEHYRRYLCMMRFIGMLDWAQPPRIFCGDMRHYDRPYLKPGLLLPALQRVWQESGAMLAQPVLENVRIWCTRGAGARVRYTTSASDALFRKLRGSFMNAAGTTVCARNGIVGMTMAALETLFIPPFDGVPPNRQPEHIYRMYVLEVAIGGGMWVPVAFFYFAHIVRTLAEGYTDDDPYLPDALNMYFVCSRQQLVSRDGGARVIPPLGKTLILSALAELPVQYTEIRLNAVAHTTLVIYYGNTFGFDLYSEQPDAQEIVATANQFVTRADTRGLHAHLNRHQAVFFPQGPPGALQMRLTAGLLQNEGYRADMRLMAQDLLRKLDLALCAGDTPLHVPLYTNVVQAWPFTVDDYTDAGDLMEIDAMARRMNPN